MSDEENLLELDDDEAEHAALVSGDARRNISFANRAAILTLNGLVAMESRLALNDPGMLTALLLAKSANNVRFACKGLMLGYYPGAYAALRSSLEGLAHAVLFDSAEGGHEVAKWLRNQLSSNPDVEQAQNDQLRAAKRALLDQENDPHVIKEAMVSFWDAANKHIHTTLQGLAQEFGAEIPDLIPGEMEEHFLKAGGDFEKALALYVMFSKYGKSIAGTGATSPESPMDEVALQLYCRHDSEVLGDVSSFAFYIAHRLLDSTNEAFNIEDRDWKKHYKQWHNELRSG